MSSQVLDAITVF